MNHPTSPHSAIPPAKPLVLVDGACALCHRFAQWLIRQDRSRHFLLGAWQDKRVRDLLAERGVFPPFPDAIGLVTVSGRVYFADEAVWRICAALPWPWTILGMIRMFPPRMRRWAYEAIARRRYAWFGKLPDDHLTDRFAEEVLW